MTNCKQACPYNTLNGCKVEVYNGVCPIGDYEALSNIYTVQEIEQIETEAYDLGIESALHGRFGLSWEDAKKMRESARANNGWIPVSERLPEMDDCGLTWDGSAVNVSVFDARKGKWMQEDENGYMYEVGYVTHWMPLPEPPKED